MEVNREAILTWQIQYFKADFPWKVSQKILNLGIILKTFNNPPAQLLPFNRDQIYLHQTEALCLLWKECGSLEELSR